MAQVKFMIGDLKDLHKVKIDKELKKSIPDCDEKCDVCPSNKECDFYLDKVKNSREDW